LGEKITPKNVFPTFIVDQCSNVSNAVWKVKSSKVGIKWFNQHFRNSSHEKAYEETGGVGWGIQPLRGQQRQAEGHPETANEVKKP